MSTQARTRAATALFTALITVGLVTGCARTVSGTVAQTTEPGPPVPDAATITCRQYTNLEDQAKVAVIEQLIAKGDNQAGDRGTVVAKTLADAICQYLPSARLSQILMGR
jgi:hypothetical protein